jgi:mitogen-activated protein kinase 15
LLHAVDVSNCVDTMSSTKEIHGISDSVNCCIDIQKRVGKGAYGVVWKGVDHATQKTVAVKKCFGAFRNDTDAQRTYREVKYLDALTKSGGHNNIVRLLQIIQPSEPGSNDLYLVFDHMESDLEKASRAMILLPIHVKLITYQLLNALHYIHSAGVMHRDIKPSNILIDEQCNIKLCDFGLARSAPSEASDNPATKVKPQLMTDYVATRWYRSPEVLLGSATYTKAVDMWAVGCIMAEMMCGRPFLAGNDTIDQIKCIRSLFGIASTSHTHGREVVASFRSYFKKSTHVIENSFIDKALREVCKPDSLDAAALMKQCMQFHPSHRCKAATALEHPYVADFHRPESEMTYPSKPIKVSCLACKA